MKRFKGLFLIFAVGVIFGATSISVAAAPRNVGAQLPASWDSYQWEVQHTVRPGEFLFMIAGYYYKDGRKWTWIYELNRGKIANPNRIKPGQVLVIRVPKGWEPPMSYNTYYDRTREQYAANTGGVGSGPGFNEGPEGYVTADEEKVTPATRVERVKEKVD